MATPRKRPRLRLRKPVAKPTRVHVPKTTYSRRRAKAAARSAAAEETEPDGEPDPRGGTVRKNLFEVLSTRRRPAGGGDSRLDFPSA